MKSHATKVKEAQARATHRATLSTAQKIAECEARPGDSARELKRLNHIRIEEINSAKLKGKVIIPSTQCEARKR